MLAARIERFGSPEVIDIREIERPSPGPGQVLVRVAAAGVGPWDAWVRSGKSILDQPLPLTLGSDIAGRVEAVGPNVETFVAGQQVFGVTNDRFTDGYAEYAVAKVASLAPRPKRLSDLEAASLPVVATTAHQMLFAHGQMRPQDRVLVLGAGGNVGAFVLQLVGAFGADVLGVDVGASADYARALAIGPIVDPPMARRPDLGLFDLVIDTVGGDLQASALAVIRPGGRLVSSVTSPDPAEAARHDVKATFLLVKVRTPELAYLAGLFDARLLSPHVGTVLPLSEARAAHEMLDGKRSRAPGKIVLEVAKTET